MKATDAVRQALETGDSSMRFIEQMRSDPLARPGDGKGNHAYWSLGHLVVAEGRTHQILLGEENPAAHLKPWFDWGSTPRDDAAEYPPFDELLATYKRLRAKTMAFLDGLDDAGLDRPTKLAPPGLEKVFATVGQTLLTIASHQEFHCGEVAAARRAHGGKPSFEPSEAMKAF